MATVLVPSSTSCCKGEIGRPGQKVRVSVKYSIVSVKWIYSKMRYSVSASLLAVTHSQALPVSGCVHQEIVSKYNLDRRQNRYIGRRDTELLRRAVSIAVGVNRLMISTERRGTYSLPVDPSEKSGIMPPPSDGLPSLLDGEDEPTRLY